MKRMELFIKILLIIGIVIYCLTGCMNDYVDSVFNQSDKEEEILEMTDEEKELLLNSEPSEIGKEWIESGKLSPDQKKDIEYIREMKDYLKKKYPSYDIEITRYSPATSLFSAQMHSYTFLLKYDNKEYEAKIFLRNDEEPEFSDTFYSLLLRDSFDKKLTEMLMEYGFDVHCFTNFPYGVGDKINESSSVDDFIIAYPNCGNTNIYISGSKDDSIGDEIKKVFRGSGLCELVCVCFTEDDVFETSEEYDINKRKYQGILFNPLNL